MGVVRPCQPGSRRFFAHRSNSGAASRTSISCGLAPCGEEGSRTPDLLLAKQALYQLSYFPGPDRQPRVRVPGFEPGTSALSELRSSQLSYTRLASVNSPRLDHRGMRFLDLP